MRYPGLVAPGKSSKETLSWCARTLRRKTQWLGGMDRTRHQSTSSYLFVVSHHTKPTNEPNSACGNSSSVPSLKKGAGPVSAPYPHRHPTSSRYLVAQRAHVKAVGVNEKWFLAQGTWISFQGYLPWAKSRTVPEFHFKPNFLVLEYKKEPWGHRIFLRWTWIQRSAM